MTQTMGTSAKAASTAACSNKEIQGEGFEGAHIHPQFAPHDMPSPGYVRVLVCAPPDALRAPSPLAFLSELPDILIL